MQTTGDDDLYAGCTKQMPLVRRIIRMKNRPTSRDIADAAGVSQATVSRALRGSPLVRPETRKRILDVARQLNYRVDHSAAGLRTGQSRTLALLLFEDTTADSSRINPFFLALLSSITRAAAQLDYDVLLSFQQLSRDWAARYELSNRADGLILLGYGNYLRFAERLQSLLDADAHFMMWGPLVPEQPWPSVGCDNVGGGQTAVEYLLQQGRRRIAFIGNVGDDFPEFQARHAGYHRALDAAGLSASHELQVDADSQLQSGEDAVRQLLVSGIAFDAVFAASDLIAIGALRALRDAGQSVPGDVSVMGFDDIPGAAYAYPSLSTVRQDTGRAGQMLVEKLIALIDGTPVESELLPTEIVLRESA